MAPKVKAYHNVHAVNPQQLEDGLNAAAAKGYIFKHLLQPRSDLYLAITEHESVRPVIKLAQSQDGDDEPTPVKKSKGTIDLTPEAPVPTIEPTAVIT